MGKMANGKCDHAWETLDDGKIVCFECNKKKFDLTYISLGAGRQSTAMAICSAKGLHGVPKAECAIFADTGDEIQDTYDHLERLTKILKPYGIPVHIVQKGVLSEDLIRGAAPGKSKRRVVSIPGFTAPTDPGPAAILMRQCTSEYKIYPLRQKARQLLGLKFRERMGDRRIRVLVGISLDEIYRMKPGREKWEIRDYPLIDARLRVEHCNKICMEHLGYIPAKSSCRYCPYHDNHFWSWLKKDRPVEFEKSCVVDEKIRNQTPKGVERPVFLHRSLTPLRNVDFDALIKDPNQLTLNGFMNECEGMCGV